MLAYQPSPLGGIACREIWCICWPCLLDLTSKSLASCVSMVPSLYLCVFLALSYQDTVTLGNVLWPAKLYRAGVSCCSLIGHLSWPMRHTAESIGPLYRWKSEGVRSTGTQCPAIVDWFWLFYVVAPATRNPSVPTLGGIFNSSINNDPLVSL